MGKQFNYYITPEEDLEFTNELIKMGYSIMQYTLSEEGDALWQWKNLDIPLDSKVEILRKTYIYKKEWGELKAHYNKSEVHKDAVIEQIHCKISGKDKNTLIRGRLFLDTRSKNEIELFDVISREYQLIVKLIKKKIEHKDYVFENGENVGYPISTAAIKLINSGVKKGM